MNILFISNLYPAYEGHSRKEITYALHYIVKHWVKEHNVIVIRPYFVPQRNKTKYEEYFILDGVKIYNIPVLRVPKTTIYISYSEVINKVQNLNYHPDFVIAHHSSSFLWAYKLAKKFNSKFVSGLHQSDLHLNFFNQFLYKKSFKNSYKIVCRSQSVKARLIEIFPEYQDKIVVGNSGIPKQIIEPISFFKEKANSWNNKREIHFLTACTFHKLKNVDVNLLALSSLKNYNWKYTIIGDGKERDNLDKLVRDLSLQDRVNFVGWKSREEVYEYMKNSDVFIMVSAPETFGMVYLEAMAKANIVVGAKGWGIDGIVKNGENGFLVTPRNVPELTSTIQTLLEMKYNTASRIIYKTWDTVNNYTEEKVSMEYLRNILAAATND